MDKKTFLCKYHNLACRIEYLKRDIERCNELAGSVPGQDFTLPRVDHTPSYEAPFVKWVLRGIEDERELQKLEPEAEEVKKSIIDAISKIGDTELESVLIYRYICWNSWSEISDKIYASSSTVRRLHDKAFEAFQVP